MFVDNPFLFSILVSGVIATVLMLALWLGLDRNVSRRMVLAAVIPAILVAVPAAMGWPESARQGIGASLVVILMGGIVGAVIDAVHWSGKVASVFGAAMVLFGGWLVLGTPAGWGDVMIWAAYLVIGGALITATRPDFAALAAEISETPAQKRRGKTKKNGAKSASTNTGTKAGPATFDRGPNAVSVFLALTIGQGIVAALFDQQELKVMAGAMAVALLVALISEKAAPQYRAAVWLAIAAGLMVAGAASMLDHPATVAPHLILVLVIFAGTGSTMIRDALHLPEPEGIGAAAMMSVVRLVALSMPVLVAALVAYIASAMQTP